MVFFVNNSGVITHSFPEQVFEGSANANSFYVVAPFANNLTATVAFRLPNGIVTQPYGLTATGEISGFTDGSGNAYYGWSMELPNAVTTYYGTVVAQVAFYSANRLLCTSSTTFTVGRGVAAELPETPTEDVYQQILQALAELQSDLGNGYFVARAVYVWNSAYTYGAGELVYYPMGTYGVYVKSNVANNTQEPYTDGTINSNWSLALDFNAVMGVLSSAEDAAASAEAAANSASAAATSRAIAEQAATSASGSASAAAASESNAESAADRAEAAAEENKAALGNYYTKIEIDSGVAKTAEVTMDNTTYVVTVTLKSADGTVLSTSSVDLPLESVVVSGSYNNATQSIDLVLQNGSTVSIPVGDLVDGLASQTALDNVINGTTPVAKASNADNATAADTADKVQNALTLVVDGETQTYDGSSPVSIELNTQSNTDPEAVHYTAQTLTSEQQAQARSNIGAQASGNYALQDGTYPNLNTPKTLYNLGAYDTYTSNGDGTATITRKTGYIVINAEDCTSRDQSSVSGNYCCYTSIKPQNVGGVFGATIGVSNNGYTVQNNNINFTPNLGIGLTNENGADSVVIRNDSFTDVSQYRAICPIYVQFELAEAAQYTEKVIENQPLNTLPQDGEQWVRSEWEKGLNLCEGHYSTLDMGSNHHMVAIGTYPAGTYYLQITGGTSAWLYLGDTYYNENPLPDGLITSGFSFTLTEETTLNIDWYGYDVSGTNYTVMLNKGTVGYPYQPYNGEIVRSAGSYRDLQAGGLVPYLEANTGGNTGYICIFKQINLSGWQSWGATVLITAGYGNQDAAIVGIIGRTDNGTPTVVRFEVIAGADISSNLSYYYDSSANTVYFYVRGTGDSYYKFFKLGYAGNSSDNTIFPTDSAFQPSVSTTGQATCLVGRKTYRHLIHAGGTSAIADMYLGVTGSTEFALFINLENTQSTAMSVSDLRDFLQNAGTSAAGSIYPCDGYINITSGDPSKSGSVFVKGLIYRAENSVNNITMIYAGYSSNTWRTGIINMGSDFAIYNDEVSEV